MHFNVRFDAHSFEFCAVREILALHSYREPHAIVKVVDIGQSGTTLGGLTNKSRAAAVFEWLYQLFAGGDAAAI